MAGLLTDLEGTGLLDETIVVFATDSAARRARRAKTAAIIIPTVFDLDGRRRPQGRRRSRRDRRIGFHAVEHPHYVTDVHATLLTLASSPHKLEVPGHKRLEMEFGQPIHEIMA